VGEFYSILLDLYKKKVKKPLPPLEFFQKLHQLPSGKILVVKHNGHVIGGMAYVFLNKKVGYEWYVCGMDETFKNLYPSELATYAGIQATVDRGCPRFDFMGAGKPDVEYGVRNFKALFGGTLVEHGRFLYTCHPLIYNAGKLFLNTISKI
jgi:lipid II:glycine glycyltransferase (peptidoglycan interpeptide bridge formation enzyme)